MLSDNLETISIHRQRLSILENQKATFGKQCPPHILIEIGEINNQLAGMEEKNREYVDRWFYDVEREEDYKFWRVEAKSPSYKVKIPWKVGDNDVEVLEVYCSLSKEYERIFFQSFLFRCIDDNLFYKLLLELNNDILFGRICIQNDLVVIRSFLNTLTIKNYKDISLQLKNILLLNMFLYEKAINFEDILYSIKSEEYTDDDYIRWCRESLLAYFSNNT